MMRAESKAEGLRSEHLSGSKILSRHLDRLAIVYVRQSTLQQTQKHQESTRLQYGLVQRARELGWPRDRIVVIDDDLGRSGSSAEGRYKSIQRPSQGGRTCPQNGNSKRLGTCG